MGNKFHYAEFAKATISTASDSLDQELGGDDGIQGIVQIVENPNDLEIPVHSVSVGKTKAQPMEG